MMDLATLKALNAFWQKQFDRRHPRAARRREERDRLAKLGELPTAAKFRSKRSRTRTSKP